MPPRMAGIPQYRERAALQSIKYRSWVPQTALHPAGEGTIASMLRKGWIGGSWVLEESHNSASQRRAKLRLPPRFRPGPLRLKGPPSGSGGLVSSPQQQFCSFDGTAVLIRALRLPMQVFENRGGRGYFRSKQF
jgi:hypothetical protein